MNYFSYKWIVAVVLGLSLIQTSDTSQHRYRRNKYAQNYTKDVYFGSSYVNDQVKTKKICFAWDLNNVVFTKVFGAKQFMKAAFAKFGVVPGLIGLKNLLAVKKEINSKRRKEGLGPLAWEHLMYHLLRTCDPAKEDQARFVQACIEGPDTVDLGVAALIQELDDAGHTKAVLSNMWESNIMVQIDMLHTYIGQLEERSIERVMLQSVLDMLADIEHRTIPTLENNWVHKTEKEVYQLFLIKNKKDDHTLTVFIDDNRANVQAAVEHGFDIGIVFTNAKKLRLVLTKLEFFPSEVQLVSPVAA
jgi:hypothetical protein